MKVALLQGSFLGSREKMYQWYDERLAAAAARGVELVLLFEFSLTPYVASVPPCKECTTECPCGRRWAEPLDGGPSDIFFKEMAKKHKFFIVSSIFERDGERFYDTAVLHGSDGQREHFRKVHIPSGEGYYETSYFEGVQEWHVARLGDGAPVLGVGTCYDQWFPESARSLSLLGADILCFPTAIGKEPTAPDFDSSAAWHAVQCGHAVANGVFVLACNRVGEGFFYGRSFVADPGGQVVSSASRDEPEMLVVTLDRKLQVQMRELFPLLHQRNVPAYSVLAQRAEDVPKSGVAKTSFPIYKRPDWLKGAVAGKKRLRETAQLRSQLEFTETVCDNLWYSCEVDKELVRTQSKFQSVRVCDTTPLERVLVLDGKIQSSTFDEHIYHECLVHPALLMAKSLCGDAAEWHVFVAGGGEGGTLREVLRHTSVQKCTMVDIDEVVMNVCKEHMPSVSAGAFGDARAQVIVGDAKAYLEESTEMFDAMVFDLADPVDSGPCYKLYSTEFYREVVKPRLRPHGVFVTQSGPAGALSMSEVHTAIVHTLKQVFKHVVTCTAFIPSFCDLYGFTLASDQPIDAEKFTAADIDALLVDALGADGAAALRFYDGNAHVRITHQSKYVRDLMAKEKRVITYATPLFVSN